MKNIVLYPLLILVSCMTLQEASGQNHYVDLLSSMNHHLDPLDVTGVCYRDSSLISGDTCERAVPSLQGESTRVEYSRSEIRERRFGLDSVFRKIGSVTGNSDKSSRTYPLHYKYINPIRLFLHISALK